MIYIQIHWSRNKWLPKAKWLVQGYTNYFEDGCYRLRLVWRWSFEKRYLSVHPKYKFVLKDGARTDLRFKIKKRAVDIIYKDDLKRYSYYKSIGKLEGYKKKNRNLTYIKYYLITKVSDLIVKLW